jgi:hypothetical protein
MATNTFKSSLTSRVGTTFGTIYSAPTSANAISTLIGIAIANKTTAAVTVDVVITRSAANYYLIKTAVIPVGGTLTVAGGDQKVVLQQSDTLQALCSAAASVDTVVSVLEIT